MFSSCSGYCFTSHSVASANGRPASCSSFQSLVQIFWKNHFISSSLSKMVRYTYSGFQSIKTPPRSKITVLIWLIPEINTKNIMASAQRYQSMFAKMKSGIAFLLLLIPTGPQAMFGIRVACLTHCPRLCRKNQLPVPAYHKYHYAYKGQ